MNFMTSDPKIYATMNYKGKAAQIQKEDIVGRLARVEAMGFKWDPVTGKLINMGERFISANTPWLHHGKNAGKTCGRDHGVVFNNFGIIPDGCLKCWKVCLGVKDFANTMKLRDYQKSIDHPCKCGMEVRDYTPKHWGGYFYNDTFDQGMDCYEKVKEDLDDHIGPDNYDIILKRGCTEFEFIKGPSPLWHITDQERESLELINTSVVVQTSTLPQSETVAANVLAKWLLWAHANGDMSYKPWNDGESLFPGYVSYHDRPREDVKAELAAAQTASYGVPPEKTLEFLGMASTFSNTNGIDLNVLGRAFGHFEPSPNPFTPQEVPVELTGDDIEIS
jgi:hypothetical protein